MHMSVGLPRAMMIVSGMIDGNMKFSIMLNIEHDIALDSGCCERAEKDEGKNRLRCLQREIDDLILD